jgi:hypothetical protein
LFNHGVKVNDAPRRNPSAPEAEQLPGFHGETAERDKSVRESASPYPPCESSG